jgi:hypothetical protein
LLPLLKRITVDFAITGYSKGNEEGKFIRLCSYMAPALPNLKSAILYLHLKEEELEHLVFSTEAQGQIKA